MSQYDRMGEITPLSLSLERSSASPIHAQVPPALQMRR